MRGAIPLTLLWLAGCGSWPDAGGPHMARGAQDWPELLPLSAVIETGAVPRVEERDAEALAARAAALRNRAAILRGSASDMEALRRRLAR